MAVKAHQIVVVGCPRSELTGNIKERKGVGKSCFCNRFVTPDTFSLHVCHDSVLSEAEWRDNKVYNKDHFLYWGAVTKKLPDGDTARFHIVEQTEFYNVDDGNLFFTDDDYVTRACSTHFSSKNKVAYEVCNGEEYAVLNCSPKRTGSASSQGTQLLSWPNRVSNTSKASHATQLFPNVVFNKYKGVTGFICLFDPTLEGDDSKRQVEFLSKLLKELVKTKRKVILACTKCDEASSNQVEQGVNLAATAISKTPIHFVETSALLGHNIEDAFFKIANPSKTRVKDSPTALLAMLSRDDSGIFVSSSATDGQKRRLSSLIGYSQNGDVSFQEGDIRNGTDNYVGTERLVVSPKIPDDSSIDDEQMRNIQAELIEEATIEHPGNDCVYFFNDVTSPPIKTVKKKPSISDAPAPNVTSCGPPYEGLSVPSITFSGFPLTPSPTDSMSSSPINQHHISSPLTTAKNFLQVEQISGTSQRPRDDSGIFTSGSFSTDKPSNGSKHTYDESEIFTNRSTAHKQQLRSMEYSQNERYDETRVPVMSPKTPSDSSMDEQQMRNIQVEFNESISRHPDMIQSSCMYDFNNLTSPSTVSVKNKPSLSITQRPFVTPCVSSNEGLSIPTITLTASPPTPSTISNIPSPIDPNHVSPPLVTTTNFLQTNKFLNTSQHLHGDSEISNSSLFSTKKPSNASNRTRGDSGISTGSTTTDLSCSIDFLQNEHYDEKNRPIVSPNICSESAMDDECKLRGRSNAFSYANRRVSTMIKKRELSLSGEEREEIGKSPETLKLRLQLKEKDKQIEELKQSLKVSMNLEMREKKIEDSPTERKDNLRGVIPAGDTSFDLSGCSQDQFYNWEKYGISLSAPKGILSPSDTCKVAITALAGGEFKFPKGSELVSAVYAISVSKPLLKPLTVNIQHCVALETPEQCNHLQFVRAQINEVTLPYQFEALQGGHFSPGNQYGSISCIQFSEVGIVMIEVEEDDSSSDEEDSSSQDNDDPSSSEGSETDNDVEPIKSSMKFSENEDSVKQGSDPPKTKNMESDTIQPKRLANTISVSPKAVFKSTKKADILYFCKVYYEIKAVLQWQVILTVVRRLNALLQYMESKHPSAEEGQTLNDLKLSQDCVEFDFKKETPQGWKVLPQLNPVKLLRTSIHKFGATDHPQPPSCLVDVFADQKPDTEDVLYYQVPVLGIEPQYDICINRSLRPVTNTVSQSVNAKGKGIAISEGAQLTGDQIKEARKIIQEILTEQYSALDDLLKASLKQVAANMLAHGLISEQTKDTQNFSDLIREFKSGMNFIRDGQKLVERCELFLDSLAKQGGPHKDAASYIADEWTANIKEKLNINIEFDF